MHYRKESSKDLARLPVRRAAHPLVKIKSVAPSPLPTSARPTLTTVAKLAGVSLMGDKLFFDPLRELVAERVFKPFAGLTEIVPAALGEEVVVHGALALARQRFG